MWKKFRNILENKDGNIFNPNWKVSFKKNKLYSASYPTYLRSQKMFHPFRRRRYILNDLKFVVFLVRLKFRTIVLSGLGFGVGACSLTRALPLLLWSLVSGLLLPGCYPTCDMGTRAGPCPTWVLRRIKGTGGMHWTSTKAAHNFPITFISKRAQQLPLSWAPSVAGVGHRHSLTNSFQGIWIQYIF